MTAVPGRKVLGANANVRVGVIGIGRQGHYHTDRLSKMPGVQLVALADPHPGYKMLEIQSELAKRQDNPIQVDVYQDYRRLLERRDIDAVIIASCNHWHTLHSIHAMQAGKHVYVEKPVAHDVWQGAQLVKWARKSGLVVQSGMQHRSRYCWPEAMQYIKEGHLGKVICSRGLCYKQRDSIGLLQTPAAPPSGCDYDLWLGPAQDQPILRPQFHYDWHWQWNTGDGDIGNQGVHQVDLARWLVGAQGYPSRVLSIGGRFGYKDAGETPNTQIIFYDYKPVPVIFEVQGLTVQPGLRAMSIYKKARIGNVIECEGGYIAEETVYDNDGKRIHTFSAHGDGEHLPKFIEAVRSNTPNSVPSTVEDGHLASALCHLPNISHRVGKLAGREEINDVVKSDTLQSETWQRFSEHLEAHHIDLDKEKATLGPCLAFDGAAERFTGPFAEEANQLLKADYRPNWQIPEAP
jgi:predicted dehydrogenase